MIDDWLEDFRLKESLSNCYKSETEIESYRISGNQVLCMVDTSVCSLGLVVVAVDEPDIFVFRRNS